MRRAKTVGTWPLIGWRPFISATAANQGPSEDEEKGDAANSGTSEGENKYATSPRLGKYAFDKERAASASESPTDCAPIRQSSPIPVLDADLNQARRQGGESVSELALSPGAEGGSGGTKRRRTILRRLFRVKN